VSRSGGATTRTWWYLLVAVLVVADVGLIAAAVASTRPGEPREAGPIPTYSSGPTDATPSPSPTPTSSPTALPSSQPTGFLSAVSATEAWRATPGSCTDDRAVLERSTDGGASWQAVDGAFDLRTVVALEAGPERVSVLGGVGDDCGREFWSSYTAGEFWEEYPDQAATMDFADIDSSAVSLDGESVPAPCSAPVRARADGSTSVVSCADSLMTRTGADGWTAVPVPGLLDVTTLDGEHLAAVSGVASCDGVALQSVSLPVTAGLTPTTVGCAAGVDAAQGVALASVGDVVWLSSPTIVRVSVDGGVTW
jgi:hypothetical protein